MPYHAGMSSRSFVSKQLLYTVAPLAIAAGFAFAAHSGMLCNGGQHTQVQVIAKAERGAKVEVYRDGKKVEAKRRRARRQRHDPMKLGAKIYRATETHWVPRRVVEKLVANPNRLDFYGDLVPVRECSGIVGLRVENTVKGGLFRRLGLRDGDLITAIDGDHINSLGSIREALDGVEDADQLNLTVVRRDKTLQKTFLIE